MRRCFGHLGGIPDHLVPRANLAQSMHRPFSLIVNFPTSILSASCGVPTSVVPLEITGLRVNWFVSCGENVWLAGVELTFHALDDPVIPSRKETVLAFQCV